jgi:hypothetical protein
MLFLSLHDKCTKHSQNNKLTHYQLHEFLCAARGGCFLVVCWGFYVANLWNFFNPLVMIVVNRTTAVKKLNLSMPVAYPFTLVKPLGIEGDVTLMDINQLISTPPRSALISNSSVSSSVQQPNTKVDYRVGLSGKSVVTRTRICTEGNGTITILRTKGWSCFTHYQSNTLEAWARSLGDVNHLWDFLAQIFFTTW